MKDKQSQNLHRDLATEELDREGGLEQEKYLEQDLDLEMEEMLEPEEDPEEGVDDTASEEEDDWEEDPEPAKPWVMGAIFAGMLVLAVILCAILWQFTHRDDGKGQQQSIASQPADASGQDESGNGDGQGMEEGAEQAEDGAGENQPGNGGSEENQDGEAGTEAGSQPGEKESDAGKEPEENPGASGNGGNGAEASGSSPETDSPDQAPVSGDKSMTFSDVQETVTPKDVINLRSVPSTLDADTVVVQVANGTTLNRTGINGDTGWSRIEYNGQVLYGVSQYLTTDLSYKPPVQAANPNRVNTKDGRVILFTDCDDNITPKEYVNLRTEPSTSEGESTVSCQLKSGEVAHRTGYSADSGWSRVEYNGQVLYVVTSFVVVTE